MREIRRKRVYWLIEVGAKFEVGEMGRKRVHWLVELVAEC